MAATRLLLITIGGFAIVYYFTAIVYVGIVSLQAENVPHIPEFISLGITTIGGTLATFLGMVLGFKQVSTKTASTAVPATRVTQLSWLQVIVAWAYFASLLLALVFWGLDSFSEQSAEILRSLSKSILGLFGGVLAILLNVE